MRNTAIAAILILYVSYCFERAKFIELSRAFPEVPSVLWFSSGYTDHCRNMWRSPQSCGHTTSTIFCSMLLYIEREDCCNTFLACWSYFRDTLFS